MNREIAASIWPIQKAYAEGETAQYLDCMTGKWTDTVSPNFDPVLTWRVKPAKPRTHLYIPVNGGPEHYNAIELTDAVKEALKAAGIEYDE